MRLPEFLTRISPVGETLAAVQAGEDALAVLAAAENCRLSVATADGEGLSLWEQDYGLPDGAGRGDDERRLRIRTAMAGACTLTPDYLQQLCVTLGGADRGEVEEDFPNWTVRVCPITDGALPSNASALEACIRRLMPAHLILEVLPCGELSASGTLFAVATGGIHAELWCSAPI